MTPVQRRSLLVALIFVPAAFLSVLAMGRAFRQQVVIQETTLPEKIDHWTSQAVPLTDKELSILDSPASSQRIYTDENTGSQVQVMLLQVDNTQNAHDPRLCMTGSGFRCAEDRAIVTPWDPSSGNMISRAVFRKENQTAIMYYWLETAGHTIPDMSAGLKLKGILDAIHGQSVRGIAVRVISFGAPDQDASDKTAETLWGSLYRAVDLRGLVRRMN